METEDYILYGILILVLGTLAYALIAWFVPDANLVPSPSVPSGGFAALSSGTTDEGDVSVELTPMSIKDGVLQVNIAVNTHSVALEPFDLSQITTLTYEGKTLKPVSAPSLSGHHTSGTLTFALDKMPSSFTITITDIPAVETRTFSW